MKTFHPFDIFCKTDGSVCIWLNGEPTAIQKRAESIWNGAKYRVATDGALNEILKRREKRQHQGNVEGFRRSDVEWPHAVCGDLDSLDKQIELGNANLVHLPDQDKTDMTKSIEWYLEQKKNDKWAFDRIVLLGGLNGRFDHTMSTLSTLATFVETTPPIVVLDARNLVQAVPEGESEIHVNLDLTTDMCGVIPLVQKETIVSSKGLKYDMADLPLAFGKLISSSNEVTSEVVHIKSTAPFLFTIELKK